MEYTQWGKTTKKWPYRAIMSLNPCCNGIYSMSKSVKEKHA